MFPLRLNKQFVAFSRGAQRFQFLCHHYLHWSDVPCFGRTNGETAHTGDAGFLVDASEIVGGYGVGGTEFLTCAAICTLLVCRWERSRVTSSVWAVAGQR